MLTISEKIKKQYKSYSGAQTTTGSIQSDVIELWNSEFEVDLDMTDSIKKILLEEKNDIYKKVEKLLDIYSENNFIIHYSSKDLNIMSTEKRATIRGTQSFDSRLEELEQIAIEINGSKIEDLIFSIHCQLPLAAKPCNAVPGVNKSCFSSNLLSVSSLL